MVTCRGVRSNRRRALALFLGLALLASNNPTIGTRVSAQVPVGAGFTLDAGDLRFIYQQILIAQTHVATGQINLSDPRLPFGLRTVDGSFNHLAAGDRNSGAAAQLFPRATSASFSGQYAVRNGNVVDPTPRQISNLIVDQTNTNPAAVSAGGGADLQLDIDNQTIKIPAVAPDAGLSAPMNTMFVFFGQFFDHGLDLLDRGAGLVTIPVLQGDPLFVPGGPNVMMINRGLQNGQGNIRNRATPFVDQNQTYTSNPSHQVFLREYSFAGVNAPPQQTGRFLDGAGGNLARWSDVKAQTLRMGIQLVDTDILSVPAIVTDLYGHFVPGTSGFPQLVTLVNGATVVVEGNPAAPISTANAVRVGTNFLDDIAHAANPANPGYDAALLNDHFMTGDGRGNENIALTAVHAVFHSEHNRLANQIGGVNGTGGLIDTLLTPEEAALWRVVDTASGWGYAERVFQAARFVTEMQYQHLVFEEFARTVSPSINPFIGDGINFAPSINPAINAEFAHAVYRFGHSMLTETISRTMPDGSQVDIPLLEGFLNPRAFNNVNGQVLTGAQAAGAIFQGGTRQVANEIDEFKTEALRNKLVGLPLDLAAINIARGRSEGIAPLNVVRTQLFNATADNILRPYASWAEFSFSMRFPQSLANFIAAYGTHPNVVNAATPAAKRAAATLIVDGGAGAPADRVDFLFGVGAWGNNRNTGLNSIDLWMGGLAEKPSPFGGLLGSTFNFIFENQLESLQNGDRFYYLERLDGLNLLAQLEGNSFSELIGRNTTAVGLPQIVFQRPDEVLNLDLIAVRNAAGTIVGLQDDPTVPGDQTDDLVLLPNGTIRYIGAAHVIWNGTSGADRMHSSEGDDTFNGFDGNDRIEGGAGNDSPVGGAGDDVLTDEFGEDVMKGGPGHDAISGGSGPFDLLQGNEGNDFIVGGNDVTETFGGAGDDVIYAGVGTTESLGGPGNDWLEGTQSPASVLIGDDNNQFQNDPNGGHDVFLAGQGDADFDMEGGDDIMVANVIPTHRLEGMLGFDWATYTGETIPVDADMLINEAAVANAPLNENRDRYDLTEGLSGTNLNDLLRGDDRLESDLRDDGLTGVVNGHVLTTAGIGRIRGLAALLPTGATEFAGGNIILGGRGSDLIEGRGGDDIIDGDSWLNTQLVATLTDNSVVRADRLGTLRPFVFSDPQRLNPGRITIDRFIVTAGAGANDIDTAVFSGARDEYLISTNANGSLRVAHTGGTTLDGVDTLWRIERLRFTDVTLNTGAGAGGGIALPNLFGLTEAAARQQLAGLGLGLNVVTDPNGTHPSQAIGNVVQQSPLAGVGVTAGVTVTITITRGALIPDVHESSVTAATATLLTSGITVAVQTSVSHPDIPVGFVAGTNPGPGEIVPPGSGIILHVSAGPAAAGRIPAVVGLEQGDAEDALIAAGFAVPANPSFEVSATIPAGAVTRTQPAAGVARAAGTVVTPFISLGADGLALALSFDEATGDPLDSSSTGQVATLRQATMVRAAGKFGNAMVFNGTNNWVNVADTASSPLDLRDRMTIEAWVNPSTLNGWETVVMKERAGGLAYALYAHDGAAAPNGGPAAYNNVSGDQGAHATPRIALNQWTHLAMTYDGQNQRLYVNGNQVAIRPLTGLNIQNNNALRIGGNGQFPGEFFNGMIDEVRVFMTVRTPAQIQQDMNTRINPQ